jgi:hypothetical protein
MPSQAAGAGTSTRNHKLWFWQVLVVFPFMAELAGSMTGCDFFSTFFQRYLCFLCRYAAADLQALDEDEEVDVDVETQGVKKGKKKSKSSKKTGK